MPTPDAYSVSLSSRARRETRKLDRQILARIAKAIDSLVENPRPPGCLKVKDKESLWRIRVGDWRIGYEIDDEKRLVTIITVGHRREFYD
ncbi:MAG TPA: type II toxin-antitoxin system RelE/ParE family toxin [Pyrinomonadaceae bacterium]|nr:type II toxin-antitoxin system RelE/ParE family toxin [Pyrinomonadaceae bacterium]